MVARAIVDERLDTGEVNAFVARNRDSASTPVDLVVRSRFNPELNRSWFGGVV
jgi:ABC-2 type transport system permease protein